MSNNNLKTRLYASRIDFSAETRQEIAAILNATLATTLDLKTQVKQAHWNVKGFNNPALLRGGRGLRKANFSALC
ncbi:MAG: hypothetical protein WAN66_24665 [Limnoraphis robusta]|uniref:Uncharacterized protein n=1 Tax=Limnoraphis robusta CS-951 TaxID=1637645 RepID=A0A0F5YE96_9CYAN|nr:hypothetical protein [Limnoraphis robusta]KKD36982.1 hypothetical protein WN50_16935 [Limnoraphis robusta CS-951]